MFDKIKQWIGGIWSAMLGKNIIEEKMNVEIAMTTQQSNRIERWLNIYKGIPPWLDETTKTMNLGVAIVSEFAKLVTIEFESQIINNDFLNEEYQREVIDNIRNTVEYAAAGGAICFKPYLTTDQHIAVDVVQADNFYPVTFMRGRCTACILPEYKISGEYTYTRLESHTWDSTARTYTIENKVFKRKRYDDFGNSINDGIIGDEVPLTSVEEWQNLTQSVTFNNIDQPLFVYFSMPFANAQNPSGKLGVSAFASVAEKDGLLQQADKLYSNILWEYKSKENAIYADVTVLAKESYTDSTTGKVVSGKPYVESGENRLYRRLDWDSTQSTKPIEEYSPEIRDMSLFNGLNQLIRKIEFQVGLAYGTISDANDTAKTATEIKGSKQRSYQTVKDMQNSLKTALQQLIYAMYAWGKIGNLPVTPVNLDKDVSYSFDDSIIIDRDSELASMQADVSLGILKPLYYIKEKYKVDEKTAREMMQDSTIVKPDPFANTEE